MKKTLLITLFGFMFITLTSFAKVAEPVVNTDNGTCISNPIGDSKEFLAAKALIMKYDKLFKSATSCDELVEIAALMEEEEMPEFDEEDMMTVDEEKAIEEMTYNLFLTLQNKLVELGCDDEY